MRNRKVTHFCYINMKWIYLRTSLMSVACFMMSIQPLNVAYKTSKLTNQQTDKLQHIRHSSGHAGRDCLSDTYEAIYTHSSAFLDTIESFAVSVGFPSNVRLLFYIQSHVFNAAAKVTKERHRADTCLFQRAHWEIFVSWKIVPCGP